MKLLVIGSGGREHALIWKLRESQQSDDVFCAPGNPGIAQEGECLAVDVKNPAEILALARDVKADLTVIGPEAPLVAGVVDEFEKAGLGIIGPSKAAARLEGSKIFAKEFMQRHNIPTAPFVVADNFEQAVKALATFTAPVVIKADGLAAGKGVVVARDLEQAEQALEDFMRAKTLGSAGDRVVIESCLTGKEMSFIVMTDGRGIVPLAPTQDHKAVFDNDQGPNTGGMGAYSDDSILNDHQRSDILRTIVAPTLAGIAAEGVTYRGFLYCGLMLTAEGPKVLEYNVRLGDPETQPTLVRLRSDFAELLKAVREGNLAGFDAHWSPSPTVCVVLASEGYPGAPELNKEITGIAAAESLVGVKLFHAGTTFHDRKLFTAGGRVMGVTAIAQDLPAAIERAYAAVGKIKFEGMHYRTDIGRKGLPGRADGAEGGPVPRAGKEKRQHGSAKL